MNRHTELEALARQIRLCRRCPGLNIPKVTEAAPGYGDPVSPVFLVGQSLCEPCMQTQIPFTGGSGEILDRAFHLANVRKEQLFITNVVHCHPLNNRSSRPEEIDNCSEYLQRELAIVQPRLIIGLGKDAEHWLSRYANFHPVFWSPQRSPTTRHETVYLFVRHPSYILRRKNKQEENVYIERLARAITWAFSD